MLPRNGEVLEAVCVCGRQDKDQVEDGKDMQNSGTKGAGKGSDTHLGLDSHVSIPKERLSPVFLRTPSEKGSLPYA